MENAIIAPQPHTRLGLGMMSGTSCDGLDLALCRFGENGTFTIEKYVSIPYSAAFRQKLERVMHFHGLELMQFENLFTSMVADAVVKFLEDQPEQPHFIGAHGHTVFHQPSGQFTYQMLNGAMLAARTALPVVCDFRRQDVALGGQGAPLVPIGDKLLFGGYDACLNLGGVANISFTSGEASIAYDIGPANMLLNALAALAGKPFDDSGALARSGEVNGPLLQKLEDLAYYNENPPKSLGREWYEAQVWPLFQRNDLPTAHLLATATDHIATRIAAELLRQSPEGKVLVTGGGAFNTYLIELLQQRSLWTIEVPNRELIEAKEALIFAFLGKLRLEGRANVITSVTGASRAVSAGAVYLP